ncbi:DUF2851 family protein [Hymenobacter jeollabukensis]|uniref:DUF2851 family protein n=1 Tax=Hymenobacter jeollabukensis TaxID=2025313 RepID=A0A5R8WW26_9BACT|nr:DUF2851 family protein [Hymenobacter jeollabukensis]TLM96656.1 DUF2851 family protein [Hymenobacter jeollabukensis]
MQEDFLHYVWQHQYFDKASLCTEQGEPIVVLKPGFRNADAGPDFLGARLMIGEVEWNGAVEIHLRASDWYRHQHQTDRKYDQVILHVVHVADQPVRRTNGSEVPALTLQPRLVPSLLYAYEALMAADNPQLLPCAGALSTVPEVTRLMMVERVLLERVEQKAAAVQEVHERSGHDWETTAWQVLAAGFGFKKNSEPLTRLAQALTLAVLRRHRHEARPTEALLFGQAGLLPAAAEAPDAYCAELRREYDFLAHKYNLTSSAMAAHEWNFLRLRPANFPTVRLAQLAALVHAQPRLFQPLLDAPDVPTLERMLLAPVGKYWQRHYRPGVAAAAPVPALGRSSAHLLIINAVVPLRVAHALSLGNREGVEAAVELLTQLPRERNSVLAPYEALRFQHRSAADSQGLLALQRGYCQPRRCLQCAIGSRILQRNVPPSAS